MSSFNTIHKIIAPEKNSLKIVTQHKIINISGTTIKKNKQAETGPLSNYPSQRNIPLGDQEFKIPQTGLCNSNKIQVIEPYFA